jgi:hypothetical protein
MKWTPFWVLPANDNSASCINFADRQAIKPLKRGLFHTFRLILDRTEGEIQVILNLMG